VYADCSHEDRSAQTSDKASIAMPDARRAEAPESPEAASASAAESAALALGSAAVSSSD